MDLFYILEHQLSKISPNTNQMRTILPLFYEFPKLNNIGDTIQ